MFLPKFPPQPQLTINTSTLKIKSPTRLQLTVIFISFICIKTLTPFTLPQLTGTASRISSSNTLLFCSPMRFLIAGRRSPINFPESLPGMSRNIMRCLFMMSPRLTRAELSCRVILTSRPVGTPPVRSPLALSL